MGANMTYTEWIETVPRVMRDDPVWRVEAYRLALFAGDLAWHDSTKLLGEKRSIGMADQLNRSADLSHLLDHPPMSDAEQPHAPRVTRHESTSHAPRTTHHALES